MGVGSPFTGVSASKQISAHIFMQQLVLYPESLNGNWADPGKTSWCRPSNSHVTSVRCCCPCHLVFSSWHHILLFPCLCSHAHWILHKLIYLTSSDKTRRELCSVQLLSLSWLPGDPGGQHSWCAVSVLLSHWHMAGNRAAGLEMSLCICSAAAAPPSPLQGLSPTQWGGSLAWEQGWGVSAVGWADIIYWAQLGADL